MTSTSVAPSAQGSAAPARTLPDDYQALFQLAPVSLWLEDFSAVRECFAQWRQQGITDVRPHLRADPRRVAQCSALIRVIAVNRRTLELFAAPDQAALEAGLGQVFSGDMLEHAIAEVEQLWHGASEFSTRP